MGKKCLSAWRISLLLHFYLITTIYGATSTIASSQVEAEISNSEPDAPTGNDIDAKIVFETLSSNDIVFDTPSRNEVFETPSRNEIVVETPSENEIVFETPSGNVEPEARAETSSRNEPEARAETSSRNEPEARAETSPRNEPPRAQVAFQTSSISQGYPPTSPQKPQFRSTRQRFRADPYTILRPAMEAQDRIFTELATAATIVPKLFGAMDEPFWVPHKYFNLCPLVDPNSDSMWAAGCAGFPNQVTNGQQVPWASQQAAATAGGSEAGKGWGIAPMAPFANPMYMGPNNVLGLPPGYLGYPSMYPYYANPNPSMPPPALPQFVNNNEATAIDIGSMFTSSGPSTGSSISSMFFNSLGMGGNPAATAEQLSNGIGNNGMASLYGSGNNGMASFAGSGNNGMASFAGSGNNGMASYSGSGNNGMALYSGSGNNGMAIYSGYGGGPSPMGGYPFPMAFGMLPPMVYGYGGQGYGYGYGLPPGPGYGYGDWNRIEKSKRNEASSSRASATSSSSEENGNTNSDGTQE